MPGLAEQQANQTLASASTTEKGEYVHHIDLNKLQLAVGNHSDPHQGTCLMEAYTVWAELPFNDHPATVSRVLRDFGVSINDRFPDDVRQKLIPSIPRIHNTRGDGLDEKRGYLALDWLIRTYTPAWLDLAGMKEVATELRDLRRIVDMATAEAAGPISRKAQTTARAAWDAAGVAAGVAARSAARSAAWDAAGVAAWDAAGVAAGVAARDATWDALAPTVATLQLSAIDLFESMIRPE